MVRAQGTNVALLTGAACTINRSRTSHVKLDGRVERDVDGRGVDGERADGGEGCRWKGCRWKGVDGRMGGWEGCRWKWNGRGGDDEGAQAHSSVCCKLKIRHATSRPRR